MGGRSGDRVARLWVQDMTHLQPVSCLYTPNSGSNRHLIGLRGCGRGCRFCLAGYVYRPPASSPRTHIGVAREGLARQLPVFAHGGCGTQPPGIGLVPQPCPIIRRSMSDGAA